MNSRRGVVFGTSSMASPTGRRMQGMNPFRALSNMPSHFGRSVGGKQPVYGGRASLIRRR